MWGERAACKGMLSAVFFPWPTGTPPALQDPARADAAKAVCAHCPVTVECAAAAVAAGDRHSVAGGLTPAERAAARAGHPCGQCDRSFGSPQALASHSRTHGVAGCGTNAGYTRHRRPGTPPCGPCRAAHADYQRQLEGR